MEVRPIDGNALLKKIDQLPFAAMEFSELARVNHIVRIVEAQPTLDYAPVRHEEWKRTEVERQGKMHTLYVCSGCNDYIGFREDPGEYTVRGNYLYCRMCGARMDGGNVYG